MGVNFVLQFIFIAAAVTVEGTLFKPCPSKFSGKVVSVIVNNDPGKNIATLKKGTSASLEIHFIPGVAVTQSRSECHGIIGSIPVPFPVTTDGCSGMNPKCPLISNKQYTFNTTIEVKKIYPSMSLVIKWQEVNNQTNKDIFCITMPAKIEG